MNRLLLYLVPLSLTLLLAGCTQNASVEMDGIPAWIAGGAKLSAEPAPRKPDNAIPTYEDESGPVEFNIITDKRRYPAPPAVKEEKPSLADPLERGREYRIRRLFR